MADSADRTLIEEWIYAEHRIQGGFDRELIEKHAEKQLERALNSRRLIAVTGSGLSSTYCLPSWASLLRNIARMLQSMLNKLAGANLETLDANDIERIERNTGELFGHTIEPQYISYIVHSYRNIRRALREKNLAPVLKERQELKEKVGEEVVAKCLNITSLIEAFLGNRLFHIDDNFSKSNFHLFFEICENLYAELYVFALEVSGEPAVSYRSGLHKARHYLRERLKWQLRDERGRCEILFTELDVGSQSGAAFNERLTSLYYPEDMEAAPPAPKHDLKAAIFCQVFYGKIRFEDVFAYEHGPGGAEVYAGLRERFHTYRKMFGFVDLDNNPKDHVLNDINFVGLVELTFSALTADDRASLVGTIFEITDCLAHNTDLAREVLQKVRIKIPHHRDPIGILARDLRIKRFLTTNYDSEIDKWLEAQGYHELDATAYVDPNRSEVDTKPVVLASRSLYDDRFSNRAEILAYEPGAAAHLFTYGSDTRDNHLKVLHIHGRCKAPTSWLVLSERDYRERYARDDDPRARSDDAMRLIFNANPLLFLGLGMSEADILRPLRTYSEAAASLSDRPAIALLPKLDDTEASALDAAKSMSSYGIYYLYYGTAVSVTEENDLKPVEANWLKTLFDLSKAALDVVVDGLKPSGDPPKAKRDRLMVAQGLFNEQKRNRTIVSVEGSKLHGRDVEALTEGLLAVIQTLAEKLGVLSKDDLSPAQKIGFRNALTGFQSAILTSFFCARLTRLVTDTADWKDDWSIAPAPRQRFGRPNPGGGAVGENRQYKHTQVLTDKGVESVKRAHEATRHMIIQRNLQEESILEARAIRGVKRPKGWIPRGAPHSDRFFAGAPSQAVINLRYSIEAAEIVRPTQSRLFLILGSRGAGRGNVFSSLRSDRRFAYFCQWLRILNGTKGAYVTDAEAIKTTRDIPRIFFNLGLSHEIVMVFDRMIWFLESQILEHAYEKDRAALKFRFEKLHNQRIERLKNAMQLLSEARLGKVRRIVIAINSLSVFYNEDGHAKNSQVERLIETLLSSAYKTAPIDFIFFASDDAPLPQILTGRSERSPKAVEPGQEDAHACRFFPLQPTSPDEAGWAQRMAYFESLHLRLIKSEKVTTETRYFVHKLEPAQPVALALRFFPKVAFALYFLGRQTCGGTLQTEWLSHGGMVNLGLFDGGRNKIPVNFEQPYMKGYGLNNPGHHFLMLDEKVVQTALRDGFERKFNLKAASDEARDFRTRIMRGGIDGLLLSLIESLLENAKRKREAFPFNAHSPEMDIDEQFVREGVQAFFASLKQTDANVTRAKSKAVPSNDDIKARQAELEHERAIQNDGAYYFRRLRSLTGNNRFCMTIIFAAIDDMMERRSETAPKRLVELTPIIQFIDRISNAVSGQPPERRADTIIEQVLGNYKSDVFNSLGGRMSPWPGRLKEVLGKERLIFDAEDKEESVTKAIYDLQDAILSTLSLIGQPVRTSALLGAPDVAKQFDHFIRVCGGYQVDEGAKPSEDEARDMYKKRCINLFMDLMVHRCLVFRLLSTTDSSEENYFSLQKTIRRYFLNRMNAPNVDLASVDQLTVSSYTSQPEELPKPTAEGNRRIRHLIERLSGFENQSYHSPADPYLNSRVRHDRHNEAKAVERLRLRAAFGALRSFYSVGVISRFSTFADEGLPTPDFGYFEAHRLRVRWMLRKAKVLDGGWNTVDEARDAAQGDSVLRTFYAEEIVWMFNECGVLSLAQGRINDALSLLTQAQIVARDFIEGHGWGSLHAHIGLNLAVALIEKGLMHPAKDLLERITDNRETPALKAMAMGYQALILAYQGELAGSVRRLEHISQTLTDLGLFRAAAIFLNYRAQLILQSGGDLGDADRNIFDALNLATNGGHEDIRQKALLTQTWLKVKRLSQNRLDSAKVGVHNLLDQVENYGKIMGIPRIVSRAELVRSEFFYAEGEFRMAAESAQRALSIATRFDLELRKISSLNRLGLAMVRMRLPESKVLLIQAREMASQIEFNLSLKEIEFSLSQLSMTS